MEFSNVIEATGLMEKSKGCVYLDIEKFHVPAGLITVLIGDNGAGKSTLLKLLSGIRAEHTGEITYFNKTKNISEAQEHIGYVSSNDYFMEKWTIKSFADVCKLLDKSFSTDRFFELCNEFGILDVSAKIATLSDGMRMKLSIASVLAKESKLLLLDEPASPLDPLSRDNLCSKLSEYISSGNGEKSVVFSSHNVPDIEHIIDYAILMESGHIIECGFVEDLKDKYSLVSGDLKYYVRAERFIYEISKTDTEFTSICLTEDLGKFDNTDLVVEKPTLSQISIGLIKEAKNPLTGLLKKKKGTEV